jgi:hypothetical protein
LAPQTTTVNDKVVTSVCRLRREVAVRRRNEEAWDIGLVGVTSVLRGMPMNKLGMMKSEVD